MQKDPLCLDLDHKLEEYLGVKGRAAFVVVILAESYSQANEIKGANLTTRPNVRWTINGALLFGVESADEQLSKQMLSVFAGRE